jgi:hypothetical protein
MLMFKLYLDSFQGFFTLLFRDYYCTWILFRDYYYPPHLFGDYYCTHYCLTDLSVDSNDITALVSGEQKHYFYLWGLQKPLVAFTTRDFFRPYS